MQTYDGRPLPIRRERFREAAKLRLLEVAIRRTRDLRIQKYDAPCPYI
jgi:hypothetical protein